MAFEAESRDVVEAFHAAVLEAGLMKRSDGADSM